MEEIKKDIKKIKCELKLMNTNEMLQIESLRRELHEERERFVTVLTIMMTSYLLILIVIILNLLEVF